MAPFHTMPTILYCRKFNNDQVIIVLLFICISHCETIIYIHYTFYICFALPCVGRHTFVFPHNHLCFFCYGICRAANFSCLLAPASALEVAVLSLNSQPCLSLVRAAPRHMRTLLLERWSWIKWPAVGEGRIWQTLAPPKSATFHPPYSAKHSVLQKWQGHNIGIVCPWQCPCPNLPLLSIYC